MPEHTLIGERSLFGKLINAIIGECNIIAERTLIGERSLIGEFINAKLANLATKFAQHQAHKLPSLLSTRHPPFAWLRQWTQPLFLLLGSRPHYLTQAASSY
ncbi:hypothetical protein ACFE04_024076 [Oxalis oulophora]